MLVVTGAVAEAQQQANKVPRIGYLTLASPSPNLARREAFLEGLRHLGYVEGQNIMIEYRYAEEQKQNSLISLKVKLVFFKVDVIAAGGTQVNLIAKKATGTIPIVMLNSDDPLGSGLVESLARPGGNVTGLSTISQELSGKRLELFREAFPKVRRLALPVVHCERSGFSRNAGSGADFQFFKIQRKWLEISTYRGFEQHTCSGN